MKRTLGYLAIFLAAGFGLDACSSSEAADSGGAGGEGGEGGDQSSGSGGETAGTGGAEGGAPNEGIGGAAPDLCALASSELNPDADDGAPALDAQISNLQRVDSNDAFCATQQGGDHPTYGAHGYFLNVFLHDADGDGPTLEDLSTNADLVHYGASADFDVSDKFDPAHSYTTQGEGFVLQLCLDEVYAPGGLTLAVDVADKAGNRSAAICATEAGDG